MTTYEYDDGGRMTQSVTVREAEFSAWDRAVLLADRAEARAPRGHHGILMSEATARENFGRFVVPEPTTDLAAKALREAREAWKEQHGSTEDLLFRVELDED